MRMRGETGVVTGTGPGPLLATALRLAGRRVVDVSLSGPWLTAQAARPALAAAAGAIVSDGAAFVTGRALPVDGGDAAI